LKHWGDLDDRLAGVEQFVQLLLLFGCPPTPRSFVPILVRRPTRTRRAVTGTHGVQRRCAEISVGQFASHPP
jgi:hypothetical protein